MDFCPNASMLPFMRRYVGVVRKEPTSQFGISFPDLPGCGTAAKTMQAARRLAAEVLAVHLDSLAADGVAMPVARDLKAIRDDPQYGDAKTLILVEAPAKSR